MQEHEKLLKCKRCGCFQEFAGQTDECCKAMGYQKECGPWISSGQEVGTEGLEIEVLEDEGPVRAGEFLAKCLAKKEAADEEQKADQEPQGAPSAADASGKKAGAPPSEARKGDSEYYGRVVRKRGRTIQHDEDGEIVAEWVDL